MERTHILKCLLAAVLGTASVSAPDGRADEPGKGIRVRTVKLKGFKGFNTGEGHHPKNQAVGYAPFFPAQLDKDPEPEWLVKEWRKNHWPSRKHWCTNTHHAKLYAYDHDGSPLWTYSQGDGVEVGYGYGPVLAWDVDGDGIDEIFARHATDPRGTWPKQVKIEAGSEWLVRLDPKTGEEVARSVYVGTTGIHDVDARSGILPVYLDGKTASIAIVRGYFTGDCHVRVMSADLRRTLWTYKGSPGQGTHCYSAADVDGDDRDEIILGCAVVDDNGKQLWNLKLGHPDTAEAADYLPDRPGLEVFISGSDRKRRLGLVDGKTGKWIWKIDGVTGDSQGAVGDFDLSRRGLEILTSLYTGKTKDRNTSTYKTYGFYTADGKKLRLEDYGITFQPRMVAGIVTRAAQWNADGSMAIRGAGLTLPPDVFAYGWWPADIAGDWREEFVGIDHGTIYIVGAADTLPGEQPTLRSNRKYRQDRARGPRGFAMSHGMRSNPDASWPRPSREQTSPADRKLPSPSSARSAAQRGRR